MRLMDIVKKLLTGATDEENARNKARMRELFNECVPEGETSVCRKGISIR